MHDDKNQPAKTEDKDVDSGKDAKRGIYGGFLVLKLHVGDIIQIGDSVIVVRKIKPSSAILAVKAKKDVKILKLT